MFMDLLRQDLGEDKPAGGEKRFCCPFCGETDFKFYVHIEKGLWICFKCEEKGNPVSFVMKHYHASYEEAVDILASYDYEVESRGNYATLEQYGNELSQEEQLLLFIMREGRPLEEEASTITYTCPAPPTNCKTLAQNFENPEAFPFFAYLHGRGITLEQIMQHNISYVINGEVELTDGRKMGLHNHLIFFTFDENRRPLYWNTRSIDSNPFIKSFNGASKPSEYSKSNTVFNLNNAKHTDKIVINEGVFDAMTVGESGVATFGKMVTAEQVKLLVQAARERNLPIYLYLDTDAWTQMIKTAAAIRAEAPEIPIYYVHSGSEDDANKLGHAKVQELIQKAIPADTQGEIILRLANA